MAHQPNLFFLLHRREVWDRIEVPVLGEGPNHLDDVRPSRGGYFRCLQRLVRSNLGSGWDPESCERQNRGGEQQDKPEENAGLKKGGLRGFFFHGIGSAGFVAKEAL